MSSGTLRNIIDMYWKLVFDICTPCCKHILVLVWFRSYHKKFFFFSGLCSSSGTCLSQQIAHWQWPTHCITWHNSMTATPCSYDLCKPVHCPLTRAPYTPSRPGQSWACLPAQVCLSLDWWMSWVFHTPESREQDEYWVGNGSRSGVNPFVARLPVLVCFMRLPGCSTLSCHPAYLLIFGV